MDLFKQALGHIAGGRVLDVATGKGGFVGVLKEKLKGYSEIVGVDSSKRALETAHSNFSRETIRFIQMDARRLGFADESFDTVSISASLHHLADASPVLAEMVRVLRPGGLLIVAEMHSSGQTEPQRTVILAHQWIADVDRALDISHHPTLTRQEIVDRVEVLELCPVEYYDWSDTDSEPMDKEAIMSLEGLIGRYTRRAEGLAHCQALRLRGEALRRRLHEVGVQREPVLVVVGRKQ
jgi:SAM-dependent methyltransferase